MTRSVFLAFLIHLSLFASSQVTFVASDSVGCVVHCVFFTNTTPNSASCFWNFGDGGTSTQATPNYCYTSPGVYDVSLTVTDFNGNTSSDTLPQMIEVYPAINAAFSYSVTGLCVSFTNTSTNGTIYSWNFGDGNTSTQTSPSHCYPYDNWYAVTLIAQTSFGCIDSVTQWVWISTNGTDNIYSNYQVSIYPNPSECFFIVNAENKILDDAEFVITNILGDNILSGNLSEVKAIIDLSGQPNGIYFLTIKIAKESIVKKLVKNN